MDAEHTEANEITLAEHIADNMTPEQLRQRVCAQLRAGYEDESDDFHEDWETHFGGIDCKRNYSVTVVTVDKYDILAASDQEAYDKVHNGPALEPTSSHVTTDTIYSVKETRHVK